MIRRSLLGPAGSIGGPGVRRAQHRANARGHVKDLRLDIPHEIMKNGTWYDTPDETLFNLGLPPAQDEGERGFLTYDTAAGCPTPPTRHPKIQR